VQADGSQDEAKLLGRVVYLHTPDGYPRSELRRRLARGRRADLSRSSGNSAQLGDGLQAGPALRTLMCAFAPVIAHRRNRAQRTQPGLMVLYFNLGITTSVPLPASVLPRLRPVQ
jgi:hypothetical protein